MNGRDKINNSEEQIINQIEEYKKQGDRLFNQLNQPKNQPYYKDVREPYQEAKNLVAVLQEKIKLESSGESSHLSNCLKYLNDDFSYRCIYLDLRRGDISPEQALREMQLIQHSFKSIASVLKGEQGNSVNLTKKSIEEFEKNLENGIGALQNQQSELYATSGHEYVNRQLEEMADLLRVPYEKQKSSEENTESKGNEASSSEKAKDIKDENRLSILQSVINCVDALLPHAENSLRYYNRQGASKADKELGKILETTIKDFFVAIANCLIEKYLNNLNTDSISANEAISIISKMAESSYGKTIIAPPGMASVRSSKESEKESCNMQVETSSPPLKQKVTRPNQTSYRRLSITFFEQNQQSDQNQGPNYQTLSAQSTMRPK